MPSKLQKFSIVMLTNGGPYGLRLLNELQQRQVAVTTVLETSPRLGERIRRSLSFTKGEDDLARCVVHWYRDKKQARARQQQYSVLTQRLRLTGELNSDRMKEDLHQLQPDFIVLGGIGILHDSLIRLASQGVLNCHPGLLPWVRGSGVVAGAIQQGIPIGCTCHYVDRGIDTGMVIERRLLPIVGLECSLSELQEAAYGLAAGMLADVIAEQIMCGIVPVAVKQQHKFPLCKWPSAEEREVIEQEVREGRALELFERWRRSCVDTRRYQLPGDFDGGSVSVETGIQPSE